VQTISVARTRRRYLLHVPPLHGSNRALPVVIMLHGTGGTGRWALAETGWAEKANHERFLAVFPDALPRDPGRPVGFSANPRAWDVQGDADVAFVAALIDDLGRRFPVNHRRLYVTGFSGGADMTFRLAVDLSPRLGAIGPVAGYVPVRTPRLEHPVPTIYHVGTSDPLVPMAGGAVTTPWGDSVRRPSVADTIGLWSDALGCARRPTFFREERGLRWCYHEPGRPGAELVACYVNGLGHHWPGGKGQLPEQFGTWLAGPSATDAIWRFFWFHPHGARRPPETA
jgi:polyhydroxybutyrate depolymerase